MILGMAILLILAGVALVRSGGLVSDAPLMGGEPSSTNPQALEPVSSTDTSAPTSTTTPATSAPSTAAPPTSAATTTVAPSTTTTVSVPVGTPPTVRIVSPKLLSRYEAAYIIEDGLFGAPVELGAEFDDPDGDVVTIEWFSSDEGYLGQGGQLVVNLHVVGSDSAQPVITVRVTDAGGNVVEQTVQVVVWIPSDQ